MRRRQPAACRATGSCAGNFEWGWRRGSQMTAGVRRLCARRLPFLLIRLAASLTPRAWAPSACLSARFQTRFHPPRNRAILATSPITPNPRRRDFPRAIIANADCSTDDLDLSFHIGLALPALPFALTASAPGVLPHYRLRMTPAKSILDVPAPPGKPSPANRSRSARSLSPAASFNRKGEILSG